MMTSASSCWTRSSTVFPVTFHGIPNHALTQSQASSFLVPKLSSPRTRRSTVSNSSSSSSSSSSSAHYTTNAIEDQPSVLSCDHWRKNLPVLGMSYRVYSIDLIGYGYSDKPNPRDFGLSSFYTFETWASQLNDFCLEVVKDEAFFICNSIGGGYPFSFCQQLHINHILFFVNSSTKSSCASCMVLLPKFSSVRILNICNQRFSWMLNLPS